MTWKFPGGCDILSWPEFIGIIKGDKAQRYGSKESSVTESQSWKNMVYI